MTSKKFNTNLIGSFVFIYQGDGILSSIYMNTGHTVPHPETAKRLGYREEMPSPKNNYDGDIIRQYGWKVALLSKILNSILKL